MPTTTVDFKLALQLAKSITPNITQKELQRLANSGSVTTQNGLLVVPDFLDDLKALNGQQDLKPFSIEQKFVLWDMGKWRGWCVATLDSVDKDWVTKIVHYTKEKVYDGPASRFLKDFASGNMFFAEPQEVIEFIALQLAAVHAPNDIVKDLLDLAARIAKWKLEN